jgi:hypothetical protein
MAKIKNVNLAGTSTVSIDPRLSNLISDYLSALNSAVDSLAQSGIDIMDINYTWHGIPQQGKLLCGVDYFMHGIGCAVYLPSGIVDFDFHTAQGYEGIDPGFLCRFSRNDPLKYGFSSNEEIIHEIEKAVITGALIFNGRSYKRLTDI